MSSRLRGQVASVVAVALGLTLGDVGQAHAQSGSGLSNEMRAEYLFRTGEKKFDSGQYAEACADFTESLRLGPKLGTLLNLALCHETIGKTATAWSEFHHGAAWAAQNGQRDRHDFAMQHAVALETKLPRVLLQLPKDGAIASVDVDGEPLPDSRWYLPVFLDPGEHSLTLGAPGKQRGTVKFRVINSPTEQLVNVPTLSDDAALVPPPPPKIIPGSDPDRTRRLAGLVTFGVGAAGMLVGLTFGALAIDRRGDIGTRCAADRCTPEGAEIYREAQDHATIAAVATIVGTAAAAVGAWVYFSSYPAVPARVGIRPRPDGAELGVGGAF